MAKKKQKAKTTGAPGGTHCGLTLQNDFGRSAWDTYYIQTCRAPDCKYWRSNLLPVSEHDRR